MDKFSRLPKEIRERMLEHQLSQTGKVNPNIFIDKLDADNENNGFTWFLSPEKHEFWENIIYGNNFDEFFKLYPKKTFPREMWCWDNNERHRIKDIVYGVFPQVDYEYNVIGKKDVWENCAEIPEKSIEKIVHLTIQDISNGKGVGIDHKLIRIKE